MELLQLKYFCHAAETENFSKTAKKFTVPPSDISQSIKRLETELGKQLFNRSSNSIFLNEKGRKFYSYVKDVLSLLDSAVNEISFTQEKGKLEILAKTNRRIVMNTAEKYRKLYPETDIIIKHSGDFLSEEFDLIISAEDLSDNGFICKKLISEDIILAIRKDNFLAIKENICSEELAELPFITMNKGSNIHTVTQKVCSSLGFSPRIAIQSDDPFYIRRCVELGLGVAIVPSISWKGQFSDEIIFKKITDMKRTSYVCQRKDKYLSAENNDFIKMLLDECEKEIKG